MKFNIKKAFISRLIILGFIIIGIGLYSSFHEPIPGKDSFRTLACIIVGGLQLIIGSWLYYKNYLNKPDLTK